MLAKVDPGLLKIAAAIVAAGLFVLAAQYPEYATYFVGLGAGLAGSAVVRRPGDIPAAGVHADDLPGSGS